MSLKDRRKQAGLTQREAAALFSLKYRTYQNYENGVTAPDMDTAARLARYFNCTIGDLFDLEEGAITLPVDEEKLLVLYRQLNSEGKAKLLEYADDLVSSNKYEKSGMPDNSVSIREIA